MATRIILLLVALVAAGVAAPVLTAQFYGEDEVGVYITGNWLVEAIRAGDVVQVARILVGSYHPPGRFLLAAAGFFLFGPSPWALRLPAVAIWAAVCVLTADITRRLTSSAWAGLIAGLLVAASGLFSLEALGFGHGAATFWVMLFIWLKIRHPIWDVQSRLTRRQYVQGGSILALGFLWFTSLLPLVGMYHLHYFIQAVRQKNVETFQRYVILSLPFVGFYAAYYLIFLGVPWYAIEQGWRDRPVGQLHQNLARSGSARLNVESFMENLKGLNWYHVPFVSWSLLAVGAVHQWQIARPLAWMLTPYALIFSFYIMDNTLQHFLSYYIWLLPWAIAALWRWGARRGRDWQSAIILLLTATLIGTFVFGYEANMRRYTEETYPYELAPMVFGAGKWRTNLVRPLPQMTADLARLLGPYDAWTVTIDGALPLYYFPDARYVSADTVDCTSLRVQVRHRDQPLVCDVVPVRTVNYSGSVLQLVVLR